MTNPCFKDHGRGPRYRFQTRERVPFAWLDDIRAWCEFEFGPSGLRWVLTRSEYVAHGNVVHLYADVDDEADALAFKLRWC